MKSIYILSDTKNTCSTKSDSEFFTPLDVDPVLSYDAD